MTQQHPAVDEGAQVDIDEESTDDEVRATLTAVENELTLAQLFTAMEKEVEASDFSAYWRSLEDIYHLRNQEKNIRVYFSYRERFFWAPLETDISRLSDDHELKVLRLLSVLQMHS